jgi:hypothetical protein
MDPGVAGILEYLQDILFTLFTRNPEEKEKRRRLRALYDELKKVEPPYFRRSSGQILPAFAVSVLNLALILRPLWEVFEKTIDNFDPKLAQRYKDHLVTARLPEELQSLQSCLSYTTLKKRVFDSPDPEMELVKIDNEIEQLFGGLSGGEFHSFDNSYTVMSRLVALSQHSFLPMLRFFDPALKSLDSADPAIFQPVPGEEILQELLDFYFIRAGFSYTESIEKNIGLLLERLSRERAEEAKSRLNKVLLRLQKLLVENLSSDTVLILLRLIQKDPYFVPQSIQEESSFLEAYKNRLRINYQRSRERIQQQLRELAVGEDLKRLFPAGQPEQIVGYSEEIDQALQERDFDSFLHIHPLRILKNYIQHHFNKELKEPLKRLIVEGKFSNKVFENMFTRPYYQCSELENKIVEFEEQLQGSGTQSAKKLPKYIELLDQGKPVHNMVATVLDTIEKESKKLVEEGANCFYNLFVTLLDILNDAKLKNPAKVTNIKYLSTGKAQEFLARITHGHNNLYLFTKIMKNFTTIKQQSIEE